MENGKYKGIPLKEKCMLTIREASAYFNLGVKKMRRLAEDNKGNFAVFVGNRYLIHRERFENYLERMMDGIEDVKELEDVEE